MFANGWAPVEREAMEDAELGIRGLGLYCWLRGRSNWKNSYVYFNGVTVLLPKGGLVCSLRKLAKHMGCCRTTLRSYLALLERKKLISVHIAKEGTLIQLLNAVLRPCGQDNDPPLKKNYKKYKEQKNGFNEMGGKDVPRGANDAPTKLFVVEKFETASKIPEESRRFLDNFLRGGPDL